MRGGKRSIRWRRSKSAREAKQQRILACDVSLGWPGEVRYGRIVTTDPYRNDQPEHALHQVVRRFIEAAYEIQPCEWRQVELALALLVSIVHRNWLWTERSISASSLIPLASRFATGVSNPHLEYFKPWTAPALEVEIRLERLSIAMRHRLLCIRHPLNTRPSAH